MTDCESCWTYIVYNYKWSLNLFSFLAEITLYEVIIANKHATLYKLWREFFRMDALNFHKKYQARQHFIIHYYVELFTYIML